MLIKFNTENKYVLENEVALIRPLEYDDIEHLIQFSIHEPEIWKYSLLQAGGGLASMKKYIAIALEAKETGKEYPFIVFDKRTQQYAGSTRFYDIQLSQKTLQLGYTWYGKNFQGTALNKNCKFLLLQFAFEKMGMERIEFRADNNNERSIAAMKSIGCIHEGILRNNSFTVDGLRRDTTVFSILKSEWEGGIKDKLERKLNRMS